MSYRTKNRSRTAAWTSCCSQFTHAQRCTAFHSNRSVHACALAQRTSTESAGTDGSSKSYMAERNFVSHSIVPPWLHYSEPAFARVGPWAYNCVCPSPPFRSLFPLSSPSPFLLPSLSPLSFLPSYPFPFSSPFPVFPQSPPQKFVHFRRKIWHGEDDF